jgi:hypothetical protein
MIVNLEELPVTCLFIFIFVTFPVLRLNPKTKRKFLFYHEKHFTVISNMLGAKIFSFLKRAAPAANSFPELF